MASKTLEGYECNFISEVPEDFYCKKCTLVARRLTFTSCCSETYCHSCIPEKCLSCGEKSFTIMEHLRNQRKILSFEVYCSMKERGCVWSGTLDQLDTHLDPHLDNCQYVDTKCPLNCQQTVPKNKVDQHVAQECTKRPHVCQHCGFKATYEEVVDTHLPECKYVALQCPNMCGVSCEREVMEDHMKICRLEEVECEFSCVGCDGRFIREDEDEHTRQNSQKHLTLTASLAVETKEQLQQKLLEQDKKHREEEEKLKKKIEELSKKLEKYEIVLKDHQKSITGLKKVGNKMTEYCDSQVQLLKRNLNDIDAKYDKEMSYCTSIIGLKRKFGMKHFISEKARNRLDYWKSPVMYTHVCGYKFCIGVDANGIDGGRGNSISVSIWSTPGEYDDKLKWPARAQFTVELINQQGGENAECTTEEITWKEPDEFTKIGVFQRLHKFCNNFLEHSELGQFLEHDTLYFILSRIVM